ncbi:Intraflagellar transport 122 homolog (Chlamydomonas) [Nesidiocoris tenuis]|uniref:Intraflagellar transport protein 122 homolog n=1 Tax=Nesidiocoris tenuis TaxID=355587 RepID=A0ABN7AHW4_9HEMI|nr:Intraflagellar transport 122 homolog (Chlamydomonas) [Nesidiocoris tenuis]
MRTVLKWVDKVSDRDKQDQCIYSLCFSPDGSQLIAAAGQMVLVYDTAHGSLLQPLKGHKDSVHSVDYSCDGKRFASGSADKNVIVWSNKFAGVLKYSHSDAVQCIKFNPFTTHLASCGTTEFILWSPELKAVQKYKSNSKILTCSWSPDGHLLALGLASGSVSIRNRNGEEKSRIELPQGPDTPVWALAFCPVKDESYDTLCVTDWGKTMSFHTVTGKAIGKERNLGFEPLCVRYMNGGEFILVSGCNNSCFLYSRDGIRLAQIGEPHQAWIWACASKSNPNLVALGCQDGKLAVYQVIFSPVHGIYKEKYAYREHLTDVIIHNLLTDQKLKIKCRDLVKKIAIYKHRLAVQLGDRVTVYELYLGDNGSMHYRLKERLPTKVECSMLVVCTNHIVLCHDSRLQSIAFTGQKEREWQLETTVRYIRIIGGPPNREGLLIGLSNGQVIKIYLDNAFPVELMRIDSPVKCLDMSPSRKKLAVVNDREQCLVYSLASNQLLFTEQNAKFVAWNTSCEDMICYSGTNTLNIKASNFSEHQIKFQGFVVGFCSSKIFYFHQNHMSTIDVPLSAPMYQYLDKKLFREAYEIACLGVTDSDWKSLAHSALDSLNFEIARKAFSRIKEFTYLELIFDIQERREQGDRERDLLLAEVLSYRGKFKEAGRLYARGGRPDKALAMFTDLRMFDQGQEYLAGGGESDRKTLLKKKADWARNINEPRAAAQMYLSAGDPLSAVELMAQYGWVDMMVETGRKISGGPEAEPVLRRIADALRDQGKLAIAAEMYRKLGAADQVLAVQVEAGNWTEALALAEDNPKYYETVFLPYARYLAENDNFVEAQKAYHKAGHPEEAFRVIRQLTENAITENRFNDASYYYWLLANQALQMANNNHPELVEKYHQYESYATIYYAYHSIERYSEDPFTAHQLEDLFNIGRYLMQATRNISLPGISQFTLLLQMAKLSQQLGAYKLARHVLSRIHTLRIPKELQEYVDTLTLMVKGKPYQNNEDFLVMCYRCSSYNPLETPNTVKANCCTNCAQPFVYSFITFEVLPLVEFQLEPGLSEHEACRLLEEQPLDDDHWTQNIEENVQSMRISYDDHSGTPIHQDPFSSRLISFDGGGVGMINADDSEPIIATRSMLRSMDFSNTLICKYPKPLPMRFFKNLLPDVHITTCPHCNKIFHQDDYESLLLEKSHCPFCRTPRDSTSVTDSQASDSPVHKVHLKP